MNKYITNNWKTIKLGDFCKIGRGSSPRPIVDPRYFDGGTIPWIKIADATKSGKYLYETKEKVNTYGASYSRLLPKGSLIVATSGTLGYPQLLGVEGCIHDGWLYLENFQGIDKDYLYYFFLYSRDYFFNAAYGAAIQNVNTTILRDMEIILPPLPTQHKIAVILSTYDNLIENNTRRIKILEEMAQAIYSEWFVHYRFPGHEGLRMVESEVGLVPEGWKLLNVGNILTIIESGSRPKGGIDPLENDVPSIGAENIIGLGLFDYSKERFVSCSFYENMTHGHILSGDILLYKDGAHIGRKSMFKDGFPYSECCINEHVFILRTNKMCSQYYLYFWLDQPKMTQNICNLNANAAQPGINQSGVKGLPILLPPLGIIKDFNLATDPILSLLFNLAKKNLILRKKRDLLLPKIVSGEVDVNELEIQVD